MSTICLTINCEPFSKVTNSKNKDLKFSDTYLLVVI